MNLEELNPDVVLELIGAKASEVVNGIGDAYLRKWALEQAMEINKTYGGPPATVVALAEGFYQFLKGSTGEPTSG